jgi:DNA-binding PadR family transcriptional regulator
LQIIEEHSLIEKILKKFSYKGISNILSKRRVTGRYRGKVVAEPTDRGKKELTQNRMEEDKAKTAGAKKRVKVYSMIRGMLNG